MHDSIQNILEDLYAIDPTLKQHEEELKGVVEKLLVIKPDTELDQNFVQNLRHQIRARADDLSEPEPSPAFRNPFAIFQRFAYAFGGVALTLVIIFSFIHWNPKKPLQISTEQAGDNFFNAKAPQAADGTVDPDVSGQKSKNLPKKEIEGGRSDTVGAGYILPKIENKKDIKEVDDVKNIVTRGIIMEKANKEEQADIDFDITAEDDDTFDAEMAPTSLSEEETSEVLLSESLDEASDILPDLAIEAVKAEQITVTDEEGNEILTTFIYAKIKNNGKIEASIFSIKYNWSYSGKTMTYNEERGPIAANKYLGGIKNPTLEREKWENSYPWTLTQYNPEIKKGDKVEIIIDPDNYIEESNENNNSFIYTVDFTEK